jgi:hypothetical protein
MSDSTTRRFGSVPGQRTATAPMRYRAEAPTKTEAVKDLNLEERRARIRSRGGDNKRIHQGSGTAK